MKKMLLPEGLLETFTHFFERMISLLCVGLAALMFAVLYYYSPLDPSFNTATTMAVSHPLGVIGSYTADFLFQIFGFYAYSFVLFILGYSIRLWQLKSLSLLVRPTALVLSMIFLGMGTAFFIGTYAGTLAVILLHEYVAKDMPYIAIVIGQISFIAMGLGLLGYACYVPFSFKKIQNFVIGTVGIGERAGYVFYGLFKFGKPLVKKTAQKTLTQLHFSKKSSPTIDHSKEVLISQTPSKSEQLSLFEGDSSEEDTEEDSTGTTEATSHEAISHFKTWLKDKEKSKKKPSPAPEKKNSFIETLTAHGFELPSVDILDPLKVNRVVIDQSVLEESASALETVLGEFGIKGEIVNIRPGPVVTMYELMPAPGIKSSRVIGLAEDIARSMSALSARIAVIPGKNVIGIELPNPTRETVYLRDLLQSDAFKKSTGSLRLILGKDIGGQPSIADLARMPHLLVAGTTGSGKSVSVNTMILSLLYQYTPDQCKFIMVDPKMLELSIYNDIPHLLTPVVTDPKKAVIALKWAVKEMENRYRAMSKVGVRNIDGYNVRLKEAKENGEVLIRKVQTGFDPDSGKPVFESQPIDFTPLPYIVIVVDEMADLMLVAGKDIEATVQRLAQMARAAGIHLIMATQRPSVDVITGTIKANFPTRMSFQVTSKIDSRTILGEQGAEQLLGQGDMLFMAGGGRIQRVHGPFVKDEEVERIVNFLKTQGDPSYIESVTQDDDEESEKSTETNDNDKDQLYRQAMELVLREGKASTSFIQRHLQIGYNRAARLIDLMEKDGVISPANHVGKREILGAGGM